MLEYQRHVFKGFTFEETCEQKVTLFPQGEFFVEVDVLFARQQAPRLEFDQRGSNEQELSSNIEVEFLHFLNFGEIRIDNGAERDFMDIDLLPQNEVQEKVERALKHGRRDVITHI